MDKKEQIEILEIVKARLLNGRCEPHDGLCLLILDEFIDRGYVKGCGFSLSDIEIYIPLFTLENAGEHANARVYHDGYWWSHYPEYNSQDRIKFIDWVINRLDSEK
jgi:hypothetical protein